MKTILFYTNTARAFRTTLIGYLYEVSQSYRVILLSEELDPQTEKVIRNKSLFPGIEHIIQVNQHTPRSESLLKKNKRLAAIAKNAIAKFIPDIVIASSDAHSLFEMYLMRRAKESNALCLTIQDTLSFDTKDIAIWYDLQNVYLRTSDSLPMSVRLAYIKMRKYFAYFLFHFLLPLSAGEGPFRGVNSYYLHNAYSGMRNSDYQVVFDETQYNLYLNGGVTAQKLIILPHPLTRKSREIFEISYFNDEDVCVNMMRNVLLLLPFERQGFRRHDCSVITRENRDGLIEKIMKEVCNRLPDWQVYVKPHPLFEEIAGFKHRIASISDKIIVAEPSDSVDRYIELADLIIDLPRSASTAVFSASLQVPNKPIISLDIDHELMGDSFKSFAGIEYVDSIEQLSRVLDQVNNVEYVKSDLSKKTKTKEEDIVQILEALILNKYSRNQRG